MKASIDSLEKQLKTGRDFQSPPLHLWHPPLSGSIDIRIDARGNWFHEGELIQRESLVRLFASILRREEDGGYYLVTPVEKWRIEVQLHPLVVTDIDELECGGERFLEATLNTGKKIRIGEQNPLFTDPRTDGVPVLQLAHGLTALCSRAAWYRLTDLVEHDGSEASLKSGTFKLVLPAY